MSGIVISHIDEVAFSAFPALDGVLNSGDTRSQGLIASGDRPLHVWTHSLQSGSEIQWQCPPVGHVVYVWEGSATACHRVLEAGAVLLVEHNGKASLRAGSDGAKLVHFYQSSYAAPVKAGGHEHVVGKNGIFKGHNPGRGCTNTLWADSNCATCGLWLHKSSFKRGFPQGDPHRHTQNEIIFVVEGGLVLGRKTHAPGTAVAVDANKVYGFGVANGGMAFINFRVDASWVTLMSRDGPKDAAKPERALLRSFSMPEPQ